MKVEKIYSIESQNLSEIHLVRDSKFWQAWERSSFLFSKLFRPFKINARFFKNISAEMVYLGFPDTLLAKIQEECDGKYSYKVIDENHVVITGLPVLENFDDWKKSVLGAVPKTSPASKKQESHSNVNPRNMMLAYREMYDYTLDICRRTGKFYKNYKFGLGDRLRNDSMELLEMMQLAMQGFAKFDFDRAMQILVRARIQLRILQDLKQIANNQWIFVNAKIETILNLLRLESCGNDTVGENLSEFSSPLSPAMQRSRQTHGDGLPQGTPCRV